MKSRNLKAVLMGLVVRKCHFDVTACAKARRLAQRAERSSRRAKLDNDEYGGIDDDDGRAVD